MTEKEIKEIATEYPPIVLVEDIISMILENPSEEINRKLCEILMDSRMLESDEWFRGEIDKLVLKQ